MGGLVLTEVGGEIWANAALAGRLAELGGRLKTIIESFIGLVKTVGARLGGLLVKLAEIVARTAAKVVPGTSRVGQQTIENSLRDLLKNTASDYDAGVLSPSEKQMGQLLNNPDKWHNVVKGNVIDGAMKKAIEDDPFLKDHLTVTPRFQKGPDIIVKNPGPNGPDWYDVTTSRMGDAHHQRYIDWGIGEILAWDKI